MQTNIIYKPVLYKRSHSLAIIITAVIFLSQQLLFLSLLDTMLCITSFFKTCALNHVENEKVMQLVLAGFLVFTLMLLFL